MFHVIYVRNKPKKKWVLQSIVASAEEANRDLQKYVDKAKSNGNPDAEGAIQSFDSAFFIPEMLSDINPSKVLYN